MKFTEYLRNILSSPLKVIGKLVFYVAKIFAFFIYSAISMLVIGLIQNELVNEILTIANAYLFFTVWTYVQRYHDSDAETDYTEKLGARGFVLSNEFKDVIKLHKWELVLESAVFYIVFTCFMPICTSFVTNPYLFTVAALLTYIAVPIMNVLIWVSVRKKWYKSYKRWARRKKTQEFIDTNAPVNDEERIN